MICTWYEVRARIARVIWGSARVQIRLLFRLVRVFGAEVDLAFWTEVLDSGLVDSIRVLVNTDKPE